VPEPAVCNRSKEQLFDHLVGTQREPGWNVMTDRLGSLQIDQQLELSRLKVRGKTIVLS
jgi:hypothetical protein